MHPLTQVWQSLWLLIAILFLNHKDQTLHASTIQNSTLSSASQVTSAPWPPVINIFEPHFWSLPPKLLLFLPPLIFPCPHLIATVTVEPTAQPTEQCCQLTAKHLLPLLFLLPLLLQKEQNKDVLSCPVLLPMKNSRPCILQIHHHPHSTVPELSLTLFCIKLLGLARFHTNSITEKWKHIAWTKLELTLLLYLLFVKEYKQKYCCQGTCNALWW